MSVILFLASIWGGFAFLAYLGWCWGNQVVPFTRRSYLRNRVVWVAVGRSYNPLTRVKVQAIRNDGYEVIERPGRRATIIVPCYSTRDMVDQARDIGFKHHLMILWDV